MNEQTQLPKFDTTLHKGEICENSSRIGDDRDRDDSVEQLNHSHESLTHLTATYICILRVRTVGVT